MLFASSVFRCAALIQLRASMWRRSRTGPFIELLDHGDAKTVQRVDGPVILSALVVAQEREDQSPAIRQLGETRKRPDMLDGACLRMNSSGRDCPLHAVLQRAVNARDRQRRKVRRKPRLCLRVLQQSYDRA